MEEKEICIDCEQEIEEESCDYCEMCGNPCCCGDYMTISDVSTYVCENCKMEYNEDD